MELEYRLNDGMGPEGENRLPAYSASRFYNARLHVRPPAGIHMLSLREMWPAFASAIDIADSLITNRPFLSLAAPSWQDECIRRIEHLLYVLFEYLGECELALQCCFADDASFQKSEHTKRYRKVIAKYRARLGAIVNAIKHNQGRLRLFALYNESATVPGYFVEGVLPSGAVGPNPNIHGNLASQAISLAYDLRLHFVCVLLISRNLSRAIESVVGPPDLKPQNSGSTSNLHALGQRLMRLPRVVFPDEPLQAFPEVSVRDAESVLRVEYPSPIHAETFQSDPVHHWASFVVADGTSAMFIPPYRNANAPFGIELIRSVLEQNDD